MKITRDTSIAELGAYICQTLKDQGMDAFLSGGSVVSIYTANKFESFDLDFVTLADRKQIKVVMEGLGYNQSRSRLFEHPETQYLVEFPGSSMTIGDERIDKFSELKVGKYTLKLLTPTDCIKDRLAAYIHWKDRQSLAQAALVAHDQKHDLKSIETFCKNEGAPKAYQDFLAAMEE